MRFSVPIFLILFFPFISFAQQPFTNINAGLTTSQPGHSQWGDYDNDGDLDLIMNSYPKAKIYKNSNGTFSDSGISLDWYDRLMWIDYDKDGDLDISAGTTYAAIILLRNDNGVYNASGISFSSTTNVKFAWGDYDNDGDYDLVYNSWTGAFTYLYRNDITTFTKLTTNLPGTEGPLGWLDYNNDGKMDIVSVKGTVTIYKNIGNNSFEIISTGLTGAGPNGALDVADYDKDGDSDLLFCGVAPSPVNTTVTRIYKNNQGAFTDSGISLQAYDNGSIQFNDFDADNDLDILVSGRRQSGFVDMLLYKNNAGTFTFTNVLENGFVSVGPEVGDASFGDYDNDGDMDLLVTGRTNSSAYVAKILRNSAGSNTFVSNTLPVAPSILNQSVTGSDVIFTWNQGSDVQAPVAGLTYNLKVGTTSGGSEIFSGYSTFSGVQGKSSGGNVNQNLSWQLKNLPSGNFYWSVQTVDGSFECSPYSTEKTFTIIPPIAVPILIEPSNNNLNIQPLNVQFKWSVSPGATNYHIQISKDNNFTSLVFENTNVADTTVMLSTLTLETNYYWRVRVVSPSLSSWSTISTFRTTRQFSQLTISGLPEIGKSVVAWGDYDNDKDLDFAVTGEVGFNSYIARVYRNDGGIFTNINAKMYPK